jgi:glycosyltransferase involved in cell wall biosynthesis
MIKRYYRREADIIFPPVDTSRFQTRDKSALRHGFVVAGRQTPYKRFDLAIEACNELKIPLVVIGDGPDHKRLEKLAGRSTTFLSNVNDAEIVGHFSSALGYIMPNMDDFGIVAVEAMAAGTPVIAYNKGGALDYVVSGKSGLFFERQTVKSLMSTLETAINKNWDYSAIAEQAEQFSVAHFVTNMQNYTKDHLAERSLD